MTLARHRQNTSIISNDSVPQRIKPCITDGVISAGSRAPASARQNIIEHAVNASMKKMVGMRVFRRRLNIDNYSDVK